jgi:hypothetical protein
MTEATKKATRDYYGYQGITYRDAVANIDSLCTRIFKLEVEAAEFRENSARQISSLENELADLRNRMVDENGLTQTEAAAMAINRCGDQYTTTSEV